MSVESPPASAPERVLEKGFLPSGVQPAQASVYVNLAPLGTVEDNFSLARAAYAQASGDWREATWEKAYYSWLQSANLKTNLGDAVSGVDGGFLVPEVWSTQFSGLLRSFSALDQLPVRRLPAPARKLYVPKAVTDATVYYPGENNAITASSLTFGQITYNAYKATALMTLSNELMRDAPALADQILRSEGAKLIAVDRDTQAFTGTGQGKPVGLVNNPAISVYYPASTSTLGTSAATATPSYGNLAILAQKVESLNGAADGVSAGQARCDGFVAHSQFKQSVINSTNMQDAQKRPMWMTGLSEDGGLLGATWALSNVIPNNVTVAGNSACSYIIAGWWEQYALFECLQLGFEATQDGNAFANDQTQVRLIHRWDGQPLHPEAFAVLAGVLV